MPAPHAVFRHSLAAFVSVGLTTAAFTVLGFSFYRDALFGNTTAPRGELLRSSFIFATAAAALLFFPAALFFERLIARRRMIGALPPFLLAPAVAVGWCVLYVTGGTFATPATFIEAAFVGILLATAFCGYWIPLRFVASRAPDTAEIRPNAE